MNVDKDQLVRWFKSDVIKGAKGDSFRSYLTKPSIKQTEYRSVFDKKLSESNEYEWYYSIVFIHKVEQVKIPSFELRLFKTVNNSVAAIVYHDIAEEPKPMLSYAVISNPEDTFSSVGRVIDEAFSRLGLDYLHCFLIGKTRSVHMSDEGNAVIYELVQVLNTDTNYFQYVWEANT